MSTDVTTNLTLSRRVAAEIRAEMARQQISGRTLAVRLGRSPNWVSLKTSGAQRLDLDDLSQIAGALGVTVVDLFPRRDRGVTGDTKPSHTLAPRPLSRRSANTRPGDRRPLGQPSGSTGPTGQRRTELVRSTRP